MGLEGVGYIEMGNVADDCTNELWLGWTSPDVGVANMNGGGYEFEDDASGTFYERTKMPSIGFAFIGACQGGVVMGEAANLASAMTQAKAQADYQFGIVPNNDPNVQMTVSGKWDNSIWLDLTVQAGYENYGTLLSPDWDFYTGATAVLYFANGTFSADTHILIDIPPERGVVQTVPSPGTVWQKVTAGGIITRSHVAVDLGNAFPSNPNYHYFTAIGGEATDATSFPLTVAQFFGPLGVFAGNWTVAAAEALLGL